MSKCNDSSISIEMVTKAYNAAYYAAKEAKLIAMLADVAGNTELVKTAMVAYEAARAACEQHARQLDLFASLSLSKAMEQAQQTAN